MAKTYYPFAYIIQGDYAGEYVYYSSYDNTNYVKSVSQDKESFFEVNGLSTLPSYKYKFADIIGYEEIGSATHSADATTVLKGGALFGVVGAMAAAAAGSGTTYDTVIYFKDGTKSVFRFLSSQAHQDYITALYQRNIGQGDPRLEQEKKAAEELLHIKEQEKKAAENLLHIKQIGFIVNAEDVDTEAVYDIYCVNIKEEYRHSPRMALQFILKVDANHLNLYSEADNAQNVDEFKVCGHMLYAKNILGSVAKEALIYESKAVDFALVKAGTPNPFENPSPNECEPEQACKQTEESRPASYIEELKELKSLVDIGVITQEEFDAKKKQLLGL